MKHSRDLIAMENKVLVRTIIIFFDDLMVRTNELYVYNFYFLFCETKTRGSVHLNVSMLGWRVWRKRKEKVLSVKKKKREKIFYE